MSALPVVITTGEVPVEGRAAVPVYVDAAVPPGGGPARNVIIVNGGPQAGGPPMPVYVAPAGVPGVGPALPVYVVSGSLSAGPSGPTRLLYDTFTDTNGTLLTAHTMDVGSGWVVATGTFSISSNKAVASGGSGRVVSQAGQTDVTAKITVNGNGSALNSLAGVIVRYTDMNNHWYVAIRNDPVFRIVERNGGGETVRASANPGAIGTGTDYIVQAVCSGAMITATVNGGSSISYASATFNQAATICGMMNGPLTTTLDDFEVTQP